MKTEKQQNYTLWTNPKANWNSVLSEVNVTEGLKREIEKSVGTIKSESLNDSFNYHFDIDVISPDTLKTVLD